MRKAVRLIVLLLSFVFIFLNIKFREPRYLYGCGMCWIIFGFLNYNLEQEKRRNAIHIVFDKSKTALNYVFLIGLVVLNYFVFANKHLTGQQGINLFLGASLVITSLLSRIGDYYYLFDNEGIKNRGQRLDYSKIVAFRISDKRFEFDSDENRNEITINKSLLSPQIADFLNERIGPDLKSELHYNSDL